MKMKEAVIGTTVAVLSSVLLMLAAAIVAKPYVQEFKRGFAAEWERQNSPQSPEVKAPKPKTAPTGLPKIEVSDSLRDLGVIFGPWTAGNHELTGTVTPTKQSLKLYSGHAGERIDIKVYDHAGRLRSGSFVTHANTIPLGESGDITLWLGLLRPAEVDRIVLTTK